MVDFDQPNERNCFLMHVFYHYEKSMEAVICQKLCVPHKQGKNATEVLRRPGLVHKTDPQMQVVGY
jgi:hypothetical protein